jgi:hypothetical protein
LSAVLDLRSTSCSKSNQSFVGEYVSSFQLVVVKFRRMIYQGIQAKLRQTIQVKFRRMIQAKLRRNQVTPATIRNDSFKLIDTSAEGAKASIRQLIVTFPIFQMIDVSVPDENNSCSVFRMVANGHNTFIESNSFNDDSFQLVVELMSMLKSEGAQAAPNHSSQLIVASIIPKYPFTLQRLQNIL